MTHKQLCTRVALWLKNSRHYTVVATELSTAAGETPDVIGWHGMAESILVECKVSRVDFLSDKGKLFRRQEHYGMGDYRYYAAPAGLIKPDELPEGWGLLEVHDRQINTAKVAVHKSANKTNECKMLMSILRRVEISTAVFVRQDMEPWYDPS
jgi:hypothetical protein